MNINCWHIKRRSETSLEWFLKMYFKNDYKILTWKNYQTQPRKQKVNETRKYSTKLQMVECWQNTTSNNMKIPKYTTQKLNINQSKSYTWLNVKLLKILNNIIQKSENLFWTLFKNENMKIL